MIIQRHSYQQCYFKDSKFVLGFTEILLQISFARKESSLPFETPCLIEEGYKFKEGYLYFSKEGAKLKRGVLI